MTSRAEADAPVRGDTVVVPAARLVGAPEQSAERGHTVAIDAAGEHIAVAGARGEILVFEREGTRWALAAELEVPGHLVVEALDLDDTGHWLAAGAPAAGLVVVFASDDEGWTRELEVRGHDTRPSDRFGDAVSLDAEARTLLVGAPGASGGAGRVYVFRREAVTLVEEAVLSAPYPSPEDQLGASVALSTDGVYVFAGTPGWDEGGFRDVGSVHVFARAPSRVGGSRFERLLRVRDMRAGDRFGASIAVDLHTGHVAVGAPGSTDEHGWVVGAVHVLAPGSAAARRTFRIAPSANAAAAGVRAFGRAVELADDRLLVASDCGVFVHDLAAPGAPPQPVLPMRSGPTAHGASIGLSRSGHAVVGAPHDAPSRVERSGSAELYVLDGTLARAQGHTPRVVLDSEVRRRLRDAVPRRSLEARLGEQLLVTVPMLAVAAAGEYALADQVRRPCEGSFGHCLGLAVFGPLGLVVPPLAFGVLSTLTMALLSGDRRTASAIIAGALVGAVLGAALIAGVYALEPFDHGPFTSERDARFVTAMVLGGALLIAGGALGAAIVGDEEARDLDVVPIVALGSDHVLFAGAGRF